MNRTRRRVTPVTPGATATPVPTATPAPPGTYPTRTNVDLDEWFVRSSYRTLAAGPIEFNVNNRGEDDHNLAVRGGGREYGKLDVAAGRERHADAEPVARELHAVLLAAGP